MDDRKGKIQIIIICVILICAALICVAVAGGIIWRQKERTIKKYQKSEQAFGNPLMGYAPCAWYEKIGNDISLLYLDITWAELEPEEGIYDWTAIEEENQIKRWREEGKHLILRFVCDVPGDERHMDIPEWLYEKTGEAGTWYDGEYGKGFAPDYNNEYLIACHEKAVKAMGEHLGGDGLISYIELGSLGHWGEWHVNYKEGIQRMPEEKVRERYVIPWTEAFPEALLLMRRPFQIAGDFEMGLYNDMTGDWDSTNEWLKWISEGGPYDQAEEENGLTAMADFWKTAPSGGEFTSSLSMEQLLGTKLDRTVKLVKQSHVTFLGPKAADPKYEDGYDEILLNLGYRLWISQAAWEKEGEKDCLKLTWNNGGAAPFYKNWPVYLYLETSSGKIVEKVKVNMLLSSVLPGTQLITRTVFETCSIPELLTKEYALSVGIEDPMTEKPSIRMAMDCSYQDGRNLLWEIERR